MNDKSSVYIDSETYSNQKQFTCDICQKELYTRIQYQVHSIIHLLPDHYNCHECQEGFAHILSLDKHMETHNNPMHIICHVCKKEFFDVDSLDKHAKDHSSEYTNALIVKQETDIEEIPLKDCDDDKHAKDHNSEYTNALIVKQETDIEEIPLKDCNDEKYVHKRNEQCAVENNILSDNVQSLFRCDRCKEEFPEMHLLGEHRKSLCIKKELDSDKCEQLESVIFTSVDDFHISENEEDDDEPLSSYCGDSSGKCGLQNLVSNDNLQNIFSCDRCKVKFFEKHQLEEHKKNPCIKKELNSDEDEAIVPSTSVPLLFHAHDDDKITPSAIFQKWKWKKIKEFSNKWQKQQNKNKKACSQKSPKIKQFVCEICQKVFSTKYSLTIHFSTHSDQKTFNCGLCEKKFALKCLVNAHLRIHKTKKVFCDVCKEGFASKEMLFNHVYIHALVESFTCNVCKMSFSEISFLEKHLLGHLKDKPPEKKFKCGLCSKILSNAILLNVHERTHSTSAPYACDVCSKTFSRSDNLLRHYLIHTGVKPHKCETCGKSFRQRNDVTKHFNQVHTYRRTKFPNSINWREKSFKCETCGKGFTSKQSLVGHRFQHTGESPYVCDICNKAFARKFQLKDHMPSHSGEKPFTCKTCKKKFATKSTLRVHSAIHGEYTPYICQVCKKAFGKRGLLTKHLRVHTGEKPFPCTLCQKRFTQKSHLVTHIQGVHKNEI